MVLCLALLAAAARRMPRIEHHVAGEGSNLDLGFAKMSVSSAPVRSSVSVA